MLKKILVILFVLSILPMGSFAYVPSDPLYNQQSYLNQIRVSNAWDIAKGKGVVVAVLDSGVDINHPELTVNIWQNPGELAGDGLDNDKNGFIDDVNGWDFVTNTADPSPKLNEDYSEGAISHGTGVSGLIAAVANNEEGIAGIAFQAKIMPIRILDGAGSGTVDDLIRALKYAVNNDADIINMSLVGYEYSERLEDIIQWVYDEGVTIVAAAGNTDSTVDGFNLDRIPAYPACYGNTGNNNTVIAVASVNSQDIKSSFSNYGFECIDLATPGEGLISLSYYDPDNGFEDKYFSNWNGTSFSTAIVSGVAALVKSKNLSYSPSQIISLILNNTNNIDQKNILYQGKLGSGRLNAEAALLADLEAGNGYLAKTAESNSVYFIDNKNKRHLFPQSNIFWSWYRGTWEDQNIEILSVEQFGDLKAGDNVIVRPGTNLIKFKNSSRIYGVSTSGKIHLVSEINAKMLYGDDYKDRLILVQNAFEANYERGSDLPDNGYPDGTLIKYKNSEDIYYLTDDLKRLVMTSGFEVNNFKIEFIVNNVDLKLDFTNGSKIVSWEENIFPYSINNEK